MSKLHIRRQRLPDFLLIGAMKSGTTTLYRDLSSVTGIFLPEDKEPNRLTSDEVFTETGRDSYASLFGPARDEQLCGEASTTYSKLPDIRGVPQRAQRLLGDRLRVLYIVREPIARLVSQHFHEFLYGDMSYRLDAEVCRHPRLIQYGLYWMQIQPWLQVLGPEQVRVVSFESYVANRREELARVCRFLGVEPEFATDLDAQRIHNQSAAKPVTQGPFYRLARSPVYRRGLRTLLPPGLRQQLRRLFLPKATRGPATPSEDTIDYIIERSRDDAETLWRRLGITPGWEWHSVRDSWLDRLRSAESPESGRG